MSLAQLPAATVKLITSTQIITSVSSAVKELCENSLDAGATSLDVKLINYGLDRIEVKDNGSGICKDNTTCMALPHYTSKISDFSDLESLETYGFRGEALNALCRVGQVTITTATSSDSMAMVYTLDPSGNISASKPAPHVQGTTVVVSNLFKNLPVRRQFMGSNRKAQEELKQVETVVKSFAVIKANLRMCLYHNKCLIWQKTPCLSFQNSFAQLAGYSTSQQLEQMSLNLREARVNMLIPRRECNIEAVIKSTPALSLVFVNDRPVVYKKVMKILHQQLTQKFGDSFPPRKFAVCLIAITSSPSNLDVNLEPNKTKVLIKDEDEILSEIEKKLNDYYSISSIEKEKCAVEGMEESELLKQKPSPLKDLDDERFRKRRKLDDTPPLEESLSGIVTESVNETLLISDDKNQCGPTLAEKVESNLHLETTRYPSERCTTDMDKQYIGVTFEEPTEQSTYRSACSLNSQDSGKNENCPKMVSISMNGKQKNKSLENVIDPNSLPVHQIETDTLHILKPELEVAQETGDLDDLWDQVDTNDLSLCLDALESAPGSSAELGNGNLRDSSSEVNLVGSEAWSMGHVTTPKDELVEGSSVLVGRLSVPSFGRHHQPSSTLEKNQPTESHAHEEKSKPSPPKSPRLISSQRSPSKQASPGVDCSLQSVSSQMGRRELAAFTKFAREIRPQIILENPGISFTSVASMLAEKWQTLPTEERERFEEIARETATTKKVWKTLDKQKKLDWVKKLPVKNVKPKTLNRDRPPRKEVLNSITMDSIRKQLSKEKSATEWQAGSSICLVGQLEPSGTWVGMYKTELIFLNHSRLQEVVINHRLLSTHTLLTKPLTPWGQLDHEILGKDAWRTLTALPCTLDQFRQSNIISADIIVKNGFKIEIRGDQTAFLTETAEALNYYGVKELKETLELGRNWPSVKLSECRPLRVSSHIKSEAMRICRKSPPMLERTMVEELLEYWKTVMQPADVSCLHSKPIVTPFYDLVQKISLYI